MPFGLVNSQSTFQRMMDTTINGVKREGYKGADAYIDNILVFTETFEEHCVVLERVFEALVEHNLTLRSEIGFTK